MTKSCALLHHLFGPLSLSLVLSVQFGGGQSLPEFTVDLRGGSVEWASKDKSSKKHVLEVGWTLPVSACVCVLERHLMETLQNKK